MKKSVLLISLFLCFSALSAQTVLINPLGDGGFENGNTLALNGWTVVDGTATTWFVGSAAGSQAGTNAAFVGTNASTYAGSSALVIKHFYRDVVIPAGATQVYLNYYLKMPIIDNTYDYFYIYTNTTAQTPVSGSLPAGTQRVIYTTPVLAGYTARPQIDLTALAGTTVRLVFTYKTDALSPYANPAVDNISLTCVLPAPTAPVFYNTSANATPVFFDNIRAVSTPVFAVSSTGQSFNAMQIEANTKDDFSGTVYTQSFSGTFSSAIKYDYVCNNLSPALPATDPAVYYVRARASNNAGVTWGSWSTQKWSFTHSASDYGWHQTTKAQFNEGAYNGNFILSTINGAISDNVYMNRGSFTEYVAANADDGVWENGTWYSTTTYSTIGYQDDCNGTSDIYNAFRFSNVSIPRNSNILSANMQLYASGDCVCESQSSSIYTKIAGHNHLLPDAPALTSGIATTTSNRSATGVLWLQSTAWTNNTQYNSPDIKTIIADMTSKATWDEEDHINIFIDSYSTATYKANRCISNYDYSSGARKPAITGTFTDFENTLRSPMIDFASFVCSPSYSELKWTKDQTYGNVKVQLYYDNAGTPTIIPDAALSGNSTGLTSPVNISSLNTAIYGKLYIYATLRYTSVNVSESPLLSDWSITAVPVASANAGINQAICVGGSATLTATGCGAYNWSNGETTASITVSPGSTTTYTVTATVGNGNSATDDIQVTVNPSPSIDTQPLPQSACAGGSVTFGVTAVGGGLTYQWQENTSGSWGNITNGGIYSGATSNTLTLNPVSASMNGYQYQCVVSGSCPPSATSTSVALTVNPLPTTYNVTGGGSYCSGGTGVSVGLSGSQTGVNYQLQLNSVNTGSAVAGNGSALSFGNQTTAGTYSVVATNGTTSCINAMTGSVTITINPLPTAFNVTGGGSYCSGGTGVAVGLNGSETGVNYQLQLNSVNTGSALAGSGSTLSFGNQTTAGTYTVVATNGTTSCTNAMTGSVTITINPLPTAFNVTGGGSYCTGGTGVAVGLSGSQSGVNYQLQLNSVNTGSALAGSGSALSFGNQTTAGTYTVVATNGTTSCTNAMTGSVTITINPLPTTYNVTGGGSYCSGGTGVSVGLSGSQSGVNYQLQLNSVNTGSALAGSGSALSFGNQTTAGTYTVVATNGTTSCTNAMTGSVTITINPLPILFNITGGGSYCAGGTGVSVGLSGSQTGVNYQLQLNSVNTGSALAGSGSALTFGNQTAAGTYTVIATTGTTSCTNTMTGSVTITINPLPTTFNVTGGGSYCSGGTGVSVGLSGSQTGVNYQLQLNSVNSGSSLAGSGSALTFGNQTAAGTYTVIATTGTTSCTNTMTGSVTITIDANPVASAGNDITICNGSSTQLNASGGTLFTWTPTGSLSDPSISNPMASPSTTTTYIVTVQNSLGCSASDDITVIVNPNIVVNAGSDVTICSGQNTILNGYSGVSYMWSPSASLSAANIQNPIASPTTTTTYTVTITNASGCSGTDDVTVTVNPTPLANAGSDVAICYGASTNLSAIGGSIYLWSPASSLNNENISNPIASPTATTTYTVEVSNTFGCSATDQIIVTVYPQLNVNAGNDVDVCAGSSVNLSVTGGVSYSWLPTSGLSSATISNPNAAPSVTTLYTVTVTDNNGCTNTDDVLVSVNPVPAANAGGDVVTCFGIPVNLSGSGGVSYAWTPTGSLNAPNVSDPIANPLGTTTYTLVVTDANGCTGSDDVMITVTSLTAASAGLDTSFCSGAFVMLNATGGTSYLWSPSTGLSSTNISNPIANPISSTLYTVTVSESNGCSGTDQVMVTVNPIPSIDLTANAFGNIAYIGNNVVITASPTNLNSYQFYIGNTSNLVQSGTENIFETSSLTGQQIIYVVASDNGCYSIADSIAIDFKPISNAFTPNNDGVNDKFLKGLDLKVFNRWGELLYEGTDGWDGKYKNNDVSEGTYYFIVYLSDKNKDLTEIKGSVTITRTKQ